MALTPRRATVTAETTTEFVVEVPLVVQSINVKTKLDSLNSTAENLSERVVALEARPLGSSGSPSGDYVPTSRTVNSHALTSNITITKSDIGLANVDNTSDSSKPVSTAQAAADAAVLASANTYTDAHGGGGVAQPAYDFTSATGLTPYLGYNNAGTITVSAGVATLTGTTNGADLWRYDPNGFGYMTGPALYRNFDTPVADFDVACCVLAPTGYVSGYSRYTLEAATVGAFTNLALKRYLFTLTVGGGYMYFTDQTQSFQTGLAGTIALDATTWLRMQLIGGFMTLFTGISAGPTVVPTTWTSKLTTTPVAALYESVCVGLVSEGGVTPAVNARFGALALLLPATL